MPRKRNKENLPLPKNWRFYHGAYYYRVPKGLEAHWGGKTQFRLGAKLHEAYRVWADRVGTAPEVSTVAQLLDKYLIEVVPTKRSEVTKSNNRIHIAHLRKVLGHLLIASITPRIVYQYVAKRSAKKRDPDTGRVTGGPTIARREIETLSHAFTKAVEWGLIDRHPFKNEVRLEDLPARDRYVEDWEVIAMLGLSSRRKFGSVRAVQAYLRVKLLTGMSQGDLLRLQPALQFKEDGIHIQRHKTAHSSGKRTVYLWSDALRQAVAMATDARPNSDSAFLFCTRKGAGYVDESTGKASGWKSMWQRFVVRVMAETKVSEPFTEHDMRAKVASDAESLDHARALLSHADASTTRKIYRRRPEIVEPVANCAIEKCGSK